MSGRGSTGGRGRGKTQICEWKSYTPGAEVYEQLWRVRKEPATVTARLPNTCPITNARARILDRQQTDDRFTWQRYTVEITYAGEPDSECGDNERVEVEHVDLRRILDFASPAELERYETEQFRLEAEAEAVALRIKAEDLARRQLQKYARAPNVNKGSRMLNGLGFSVGPTARSRGRPRGNRGKIRGRTRGLDLSPRQLEKDEHAELVDSEPMRFSCPTENMEQRAHTSPTIMRSAFVAHSALSGSPIPTRLSDSVPRQRHSEHSEPEDVADLALSDHHVNSTAGHLPAPTINTGGDDYSKDHPYARLSGMEVTLSSSSSTISSTKMVDVFRKTMPSSDRPSIVASDQDDTISAQLPSQRDELNEQMNDGMMHLHTSHARQHLPEHDKIDNADADGTEEYAVEAIVDHFREHGMNYYLVKWEGYEDSHDWLPEVDLGGAADLVTEYKERIG